MKRAIFAVCPDERQKRIHSQVRNSWEAFADRYGLDVIVADYSITNGKHPYWDLWFCFDHVETAGYDQLLLLDNDVWIRPGAANPFDSWSGELIGSAIENGQGDWAHSFRPYYGEYEVDVPEDVDHLEVYNSGVMLVTRKHRQWIQDLFELWLATTHKRARNSDNPRKRSFYVAEADSPFMSCHLQLRSQVETLPVQFNWLFWWWYSSNNSFPKRWFLYQTKLAQISYGKVPELVWRILFRHALNVLRKYRGSADFLHFAASKSPLFLINHL